MKDRANTAQHPVPLPGPGTESGGSLPSNSSNALGFRVSAPSMRDDFVREFQRCPQGFAGDELERESRDLKI